MPIDCSPRQTMCKLVNFQTQNVAGQVANRQISNLRIASRMGQAVVSLSKKLYTPCSVQVWFVLGTDSSMFL